MSVANLALSRPSHALTIDLTSWDIFGDAISSENQAILTNASSDGFDDLDETSSPVNFNLSGNEPVFGFDLELELGLPDGSLGFDSGESSALLTQTLTDEKVLIVFSVTQTEYIGSAEDEEIIGNDLDNTIDGGGGDNTIEGNGGNDRFIITSGQNLVDGGEGIDTAQIDKTRAEAGEVSKIGEIVRIGTDNTLLNMEFIEFSDVRLAVDTLAVTPILTVTPTLPNGIPAILVPEGDSGSQLATFTVNLSSAAPVDAVIDFATQPGSAATERGIDFVETAGQLTIPAGELSGEISVEILGDTNALENNNEQVLINLTAVSGGTFANGAATTRAGVGILNDDAVISWSFRSTKIIEGSPGAPSTFSFSIDRVGDLRGSDTVEVQIVPAGSNPVEESDFVDGFFFRQVTFAPGEQSKTIRIPITADLDAEGDETFEIRLTDVSGSASVVSAPEGFLLTITNDDFQDIQGTSARDTLTGTDSHDMIIGFRGADILLRISSS